jgi:hypothetical protein
MLTNSNTSTRQIMNSGYQKKLGKLYFDRVVSKLDSVIELYSNHDQAFDRYYILAEKWSTVLPLDSLKDTLYAEFS